MGQSGLSEEKMNSQYGLRSDDEDDGDDGGEDDGENNQRHSPHQQEARARGGQEKAAAAKKDKAKVARLRQGEIDEKWAGGNNGPFEGGDAVEVDLSSPVMLAQAMDIRNGSSVTVSSRTVSIEMS
jgi:hypothetical protein